MGFLDTNEVRTRYTATDETTAVTKKVESGLGNMVKMAARAVTAFVGVRAAARGYQQAIADAREIQAFNSRLGISVERLQELKFAAEQNNVAFAQLSIGIQRSTRRIAEAAQGQGEAKSALKELRLEATELVKLTPDQQFDRIAESLSKVSNQSDRVRLAFKLFDSEGVALTQMFDKLGPNVRQAADQLRGMMGGPLSAEEIAKLDEAGRFWGKLGTAIKLAGARATIAANEIAKAVAAGSQVPGGSGFGVQSDLGEFRRKEGLSLRQSPIAPEPIPRPVRPIPKRADPNDRESLMIRAGAPALAIRDVGPKLEGDWEKTILHGWQRVGEAQDKQVAQLEAITEQVGGVEGAYNDVGESVRTATDRTMEWAIASRQQAEELGATMVDVAFAFADDWATVMAQATFGVMSFAEAAKQAFRSLAIAAVAELNKIIARAIVLATLKAILGFGDGGLVGKASSSGGSGGVGTQVGGGKVVMAAGGTVRAAGGWNVPGYGGGDIVQALLEPGEGVINKQAVRAIGGPSAITRMNLASGLPSMSSAGPGGSSQRRNVNLSVSISTVMGSRGEAMAVANAFVQYAKASGALA